jgi:putative tryptophan/tyrosine transport system substrate-binding protein
MRRRNFIALLGSVAAWPFAARAQQGERMRRIGLLLAVAEDDVDMQTRLAGFRQVLERRGWSDGRNIRIDYRFAGGHADRFQVLAKELIALQPDVILVQSPPVAAVMQRETRAIAIVFVDISDPIGPGFVASLARPGGNLAGVITFEAGIPGKWLAMLKEIAPGLAHVALVSNPKTTSFNYWRQAAEATAPSVGIELLTNEVETASDIERAIDACARVPNGGLLLPPDTTTIQHRDLVIALAAQHRLPAVYSFRFFVVAGGLMSYSVDFVEQYRRAASYVDGILRGANPADLAVQAPTKFETAINLKAAKAIGLTVPPGLLVAADEVIE